MCQCQMTFTGGTCQNRYAIGYADVQTAFALKINDQHHGPMQVRLYEHPFHTLGIDLCG